ncbi:MAG: hypothetical protein ACI9MF_001154 [Gammaproteobacteria bacterium]|jgi:hypothetical protein
MNPDKSNALLSDEDINSFLNSYLAPIRLSGILDSGYPIICSLWFEHRDNAIWCATKKTSRIARVFADNTKCAFELAPNEPPYYGVRGQGIASLHLENTDDLLERLIIRYLGNNESRLAKKLLNNTATEVVIKVEPTKIFSWDYRKRMEESGKLR